MSISITTKSYDMWVLVGFIQQYGIGLQKKSKTVGIHSYPRSQHTVPHGFLPSGQAPVRHNNE